MQGNGKEKDAIWNKLVNNVWAGYPRGISAKAIPCQGLRREECATKDDDDEYELCNDLAVYKVN